MNVVDAWISNTKQETKRLGVSPISSNSILSLFLRSWYGFNPHAVMEIVANNMLEEIGGSLRITKIIVDITKRAFEIEGYSNI